jgi:hypothetical protein
VNVNRLIRISYGDYHLQTIPPGMAIEVPVKPIKSQRRQGHLFPKPFRTNNEVRKNIDSGGSNINTAADNNKNRRRQKDIQDVATASVDDETRIPVRWMQG